MAGQSVCDPRLLTGADDREDSAVVRFPDGAALVQTVDFLPPIVNNPYYFGQIAAANALSDVYAMGATPLCAMNIVCFPSKKRPIEELRAILEGGREILNKANVLLAGGHSVEDEEIKYGLSVSGTVAEKGFASNVGFQLDDELLLTKPIGSGILSTALKADWEESDKIEAELHKWCAMLNKGGGEVIARLGLRGATDITGFGLLGHALEVARASKVSFEIWQEEVPFLKWAAELAATGLVPEGSYANRNYCSQAVEIAENIDPVRLDILFDAQTSGGLLLAVPPQKLQQAKELLLESGSLAAHIGKVTEQVKSKDAAKIRIV